MTEKTKRHFRGFTLVELLVVIAIIGILAALITVAATRAMTMASEAAILIEIGQLETALKTYRNEFGSYPPVWDGVNSNGAVRRHLKKRFPRIDATEQNNIVALNLTSSEALVFWLAGFKPDPVRPVSGSGLQQPRFEFERTRLRILGNSGGALNVPYVEYCPPRVSAPVGNTDPNVQRKPYIYIPYTSYGFRYIAPRTATYASTPGKGAYFYEETPDGVAPVAATAYTNPDSFQIISAGLDNFWGSRSTNSSSNFAAYPSGDGYQKVPPDAVNWDNPRGDLDNLTNFAPRNLGNAIP